MDMAESGAECFDTDPNVATVTPTTVAPAKTNNAEYKECANCGVCETPLWRKYNDHDLCNACGIYFRVNGFHRPFLPNMRKLLSSARKMGLSCVNCSTKITSMWRRTPEGESICNACGLYFRLNGVKRPVSMRKDWIRKRQRKTQQISGIMRLANQTSVSSIINSVSSADCQTTSSTTTTTLSCNNTHFEQTTNHSQSTSQQQQCFSSIYSSCEPTSTYKPVDYVQYYTDYGTTTATTTNAFQQQLHQILPVHAEPMVGQEMTQVVGQPMVPCLSSISYLQGMQSYATDEYMHGYGDLKTHH